MTYHTLRAIQIMEYAAHDVAYDILQRIVPMFSVSERVRLEQEFAVMSDLDMDEAFNGAKLSDPLVRRFTETVRGRLA